MKSIRLIPVVIFAAVALLMFKGIALLTTGSYVLTGPVAVMAEEHGGGASGGSSADGALPQEVMMSDANPTIGDTAPTMSTQPEAGGHGGGDAPADPAAHGDPSSDAGAPADVSATEPPPAADAHGDPGASSAGGAEMSAATACPDVAAADGHAAPAAEGHGAPAEGAAPAADCGPQPLAVNEHGDALPTVTDANGNIVLMPGAGGNSSEAVLLQRLGDRRAELDKREQDLAMRSAVVTAAEQKLDAQAKHLAELEAQVAALVDQKQAAEDASFKAVVSMYETMKPKDAAKIFDTLNLQVLIKIGRAMNPRKMSPILALMGAAQAEALTTAFATPDPAPTMIAAGENLAALPQIVGQ